MKENITGRVGRIVSSSVNALVDAIENAAPEMVMEEAIREVDSALDEVRTELGKVLAQKHLAGQRLSDNRKKHTDLSEKAQIAVSENRDDLAEAAIAQLMDIEVQIPVLERAVTDSATRETELEGYTAALQAKRREMREELLLFNKAQEQSVTAESNFSATSVEIASKVNNAGSAFDRIMEKNTGLPSSSSSVANGAKLAELEELTRQNRIKERLAAIKASE